MTLYSKQKIRRIVIFGDSLSDAGLMYSSKFGKILLKTHMLTETRKNRFTDGYVWCDWLKDYIISTCLDQTSIDLIIKGQESNNQLNTRFEVLNNAVGGSTAGHYGIGKTLKHFKIKQMFMGQILDCLDNQFTKFAKTKAGNKSVLLETLFIIWAGANDLITLGWNDKQGVEYAIKGIFKTADKIASIGGKNFLIINMPSISVAPRFQTSSQKDKEYYEDLVKYFNLRLEAEAQKFNKGNMVTFDVNSVLDDLHQNKYEFVTYEGKRYYLNITNSSQGKSLVSQIQGKFAYFDDVHPTIYVHGLLGMIISIFLVKKFKFIM